LSWTIRPMRWIIAAALPPASVGCVGGVPCAGPTPTRVAACSQNPVFLSDPHHERVWETVVDVVDDHFKIEREEPVRQIGSVLTEGRLDTFPKVGATLFEPWHRDSADAYERLESTLQSIRRHAEVKVTPDKGGYWVEVVVLKEVEDVMRPTQSSAGAATFRNDSSLTRVVSPAADQQINEGWIPLGRDPALEQRILAELHSRVVQPARRAVPSVLY